MALFTFTQKALSISLEGKDGEDWIDSRIYEGMPGWPSGEKWQALNQSVDGRLSNCLPAVCGSATPGVYAIVAQSAQDVSAGVKFATENNLRVTVMGTGHDFLNRNQGQGSLVINTRSFRGVQVVRDYVPQGAPNGTQPQPAVVIKAGHTFIEISPEIEEAGFMMVEAADPTVGAAGGWVQGGGHGPLANQYGLGCDNAISFEVVLPSGEIVTANDFENPDLFYALRGGGATTYGVVTQVTSRLHPLATTNAILVDITGPQEQFFDAMAYLYALSPNMTDFGFTGYPTQVGNTYSGFFGAPGKTDQQTSDFFDPIAAHIRQLGVNVTTVLQSRRRMKREGADTAGASKKLHRRQAGQKGRMSSRLIARTSFSEQNVPAIRKMIVDATRNGNSSYSLLPYPILGGQVAKNKDLEVGVNPAWRDASMHLIALGLTTHEDKLINIAAMDPLSVNSGSYWNEGYPGELDWKKTFFGGGEHYEKLLALKKKFDPTNSLWCQICVGADLLVLKEDGKLYPA
ncbi:FAD-binding domain-containing protein [Eremomyces bilateralis CBS 781.70]|uniref:FAD-binding domain-containing protein n=1 Tax=Eremomyces bilateralis CBS 781.70 TaxID=1392243 RepID=A0A6G1G576_9PEZI|nr:FAD-binding domain-containing protein [Eremomyces bilateralis CBS 781.70]KAF1813050.1 FAD-binding domain-containing protein [Eremomyces bilateralis CBS 781.70]